MWFKIIHYVVTSIEPDIYIYMHAYVHLLGEGSRSPYKSLSYVVEVSSSAYIILLTNICRHAMGIEMKFYTHVMFINTHLKAQLKLNVLGSLRLFNLTLLNSTSD